MVYRSMLTAENIESCVRRLRKEEDGADYCDSLITRFRELMTKLDIKISNGIKCEAVNDNGTYHSFVQYKVIVSRKYRTKVRKTSFVFNVASELGEGIVNLSQPDLCDVLLHIRLTLGSVPDDFKKYCEESHKNPEDPTSKADYRKEVKTAKGLEKIFNEKEMTCLPTSSSINDSFFKGRTMVCIDNSEYNMLTDLEDQVQYYDKLLSQYGYDPKRDEWNTKQFPITQTDQQMEGIKSDIVRSDRVRAEYNDYLDSLSRKYNIDVDNENFISLPMSEWAGIKIEK